jgi:hypothetical protein
VEDSVAFEVRLSNWPSNGREFLNYTHKLLGVDLVDRLQNAMSLEGNCLHLKKKARSKQDPHFVTV